MNLLEQLYSPTAKDRLSGLFLRRWTNTFFNAAAATTVSASSAVCPPDVCRLVTNISVNLGSGGGQYVRQCVVYAMVDSSGVLIASYKPPDWEFAAGGPTGVPFALQTVNPDFILMPGEYLNGTTVWSAGVNPNQALFYASGWEIPRGNVQR